MCPSSVGHTAASTRAPGWSSPDRSTAAGARNTLDTLPRDEPKTPRGTNTGCRDRWRSRSPPRGRPTSAPRGVRRATPAARGHACTARSVVGTPRASWAPGLRADEPESADWNSRRCSHRQRARSPMIARPCLGGQCTVPVQSAGMRPGPGASAARARRRPGLCGCGPPRWSRPHR